MKYFFFGCIFCVALFAPFFFKGQYLFPGSFMTAWYEPWKSDMGGSGQTPAIVHKPLADDVFRQLYPLKKLAAERIAQFHLPLWNPYNGAGQPLLATMHPGYLNPFSLILSMIPNGFGWTLYVFLQIPFLFAGMFLYMRIRGVSRRGAFVSSIALCLSGFVTVRLVYGDYVYALAFFVWVLASIEWYQHHAHQRFVLFLTAIFIACIWFSTQPQIALYLLIYVAAYSYIFIRIKPFSSEYRSINHVFWRKILRIYSKFNIQHSIFFVLFLGTGIASIQLLPTLELYTRSVIDVTTSSFIIGRFLLPAPHFISLLIPNFFGNQGTYNYFGAGDFVESMTALGSIPLLLALASAYSDKFPRRLFLFLVFSALAAIMLSISSPITRFIYGIGVPIFSTSVPSRILMLAVFSLSVLAGFGADFLCSQKRRKEIGKAMVYIGFLLVSVLLYALFFLVTRAPCPSASIVNCRMISVRTTFFELIVFLLWSLSLFVSIKAKALWIQNMFVFLSIFIVAAGGLYNAQKLLPFSPKEMMYPKSEVIQTLQSLGGSGRVFGIGEGKIATDIATELRISDPEYYDPLYIRRYGELVAYANQGIYPSLLARSDVEIVRDATVSAEVHFRRNRLFDLLSVRYLYGKLSDFPGDLFGNTIWQGTAYRIVERLAPLPHAYFVHQYIAKKTNQEILSALFDPSFNPHVSVLLEKDIPLDVSVPSPVLSLSDFIVQKTVQNEYLKFWVKTNAPGVFVLTDNFYPGWQAVVDGKKAQIYRANYTFRAVALAQGEHTVEFFYQPNSLTIGILFAFVCILVLVAFVGPLTRLIESII